MHVYIRNSVGPKGIRGCIAVAVALASGALTLVPLAGASGAGSPLLPTPIGLGPEFHPRALSSAVARGEPVGGLRCARAAPERFGVHLELFGRGRAVVVPAGIGVAPPWRTLRPHVIDGRCSYRARTRTPIGVIEVTPGRPLTIGQFFDLWGQPLGARRLAGFSAVGGERVRAFVDGSPWNGRVRSIPLRRHAVIALELGRHVPPHPSFRFGMGL